MAKARKKTTRKRGASRGAGQGGGGMKLFLAGFVVGLGVAAVLFFAGYIPGKPQTQPVANTSQAGDEIEPAEDSSELAASDESNRYDFFTVLPEMEVVVPDQQLDREALNDAGNEAASGRYLLQAGSFRTAAEAEQRKARLALLGNSASIQRVDINGEAWHRVRIGPVDGARRADEIRRQLQENGIDTLVLKDSS